MGDKVLLLQLLDNGEPKIKTFLDLNDLNLSEYDLKDIVNF